MRLSTTKAGLIIFVLFLGYTVNGLIFFAHYPSTFPRDAAMSPECVTALRGTLGYAANTFAMTHGYRIATGWWWLNALACEQGADGVRYSTLRCIPRN